MNRKLAVLTAGLAVLCACGAPREAMTPTAPATTLRATTTPTEPPPPTPSATPPPTAAPTPTQTPTETPVPGWRNEFQLGLHTDSLVEHRALMAEFGASWVAQHAWHFEGDTVSMGDFVSRAHENDLLAFVSVTGDWTRGYEPEYQTEFVTALANLAADGADAIEVWDEPNSLSSMPVVDPALYSELLCAAYSAIKKANPATFVVSGPPAPTDSSEECTGERCGDAQWLEALAEEGAFGCADFVGARYTAGASGPRTSIGHPSGLDHHSFYFLPTVRRYYEAAGGETLLAFSQFGYLSPEGFGDPPMAFWWAAGTSAAHQAGWTAEAVLLASRSEMVGMMMIWNLDATDWGGDYDSVRGGYALIRPDGSCLTCQALSQAYGEP